jgi:hypothetical protein
MSLVPREAFLSNGVNDDSGEILLGPGDSHYELRVTVLEADDPQVGFPAFRTAAPASDELAVTALLQMPLEERPLALSVCSKLLRAWSRIHIVAAIGFGGLSLGIIALVMLSVMFGPAAIGFSGLAVGAGLVATFGMVVIVFSAAFQNLLLADLARSLRQLHTETPGNGWSNGESTGAYPRAPDRGTRA